MQTVAGRFGEWLRLRREAMGLTAYRLEALSGVPRSSLSNFETGAKALRLTPETAAKLAPHLDVSAEQMQAMADLDDLGPERIRRAYLALESKQTTPDAPKIDAATAAALRPYLGDLTGEQIQSLVDAYREVLRLVPGHPNAQVLAVLAVFNRLLDLRAKNVAEDDRQLGV